MAPKAVSSMTPMEQAKAEVKAELDKKAVSILKRKLHELDKAERIVANIKRDIEDLEEAIEQGNLPGED